MNGVDIKFESAKRNANELMETLNKMISILNNLEEKVDNMKWSGSNATKFKTSIKEARNELDLIYKNHISKIPERIDESVRKYQMYEN